MEYRALGRTGLRVSALSLGASSLGGVFRSVDEPACLKVVHDAIELGINLIDVAPYYGQTKAETMLGKALKSVPRDRYILATKVGRYGPDVKNCDYSAGRVTISVDESLKRLGVSHVDLIQVHDIEFGKIEQIIGETIPALRKIVQQGKARFVGITGLPLPLFRRVVEQVPVDTVLSYCRYTLNDTALNDYLPRFRARGVGVISASPLCMGLLTNRGAPQWHPAPAAVKEACAKAAAHCRAAGADIEKLAIQFALAHPDIDSVLVSTANPENLRKNIRWIGEPMDRALLRKVQEILAPVRNVTWPQGRAENN